MDSIVSIILSLVCSLSCCAVFVVLVLAIIGTMFLRKRGKKKVTPKEAIVAGAEVSRMWVRGEKSREELMREDDDEG